MIINNDIEFELEEFLKEEMEQSKMTPSSGVWANINKEIQPKYRWSYQMLTLLMLFVPYSLMMYYLPYKTNHYLAGISQTTNVSTDNNQNTSFKLSKTSSHKTNSLNHSSINKTEIVALSDNINENADNNISAINLKNDYTENKAFSVDLHTVPLSKELLKVSTVKNVSLSIKSIRIPKQHTTNNIIAKNDIQNKNSSKLSLELYVTPSTSYRTITDDKTRLEYYRNIYRNSAFTDNIAAKNVNTVVNQKSSTGIEVGMATGYAITSRLKLKTGLQFNISQFTTEAYKSTGMANFAFVKNNKLDSVSDNAQYSTAGTDKVTLTNSIYQLSMPIGIQWNLVKKNNFSIGLGTSLQPSYLIKDNSYVLSTDYKYFSKGNKFSRQWNLNSSVDVSFNFTNKMFTWYLAPQFRY